MALKMNRNCDGKFIGPAGKHVDEMRAVDQEYIPVPLVYAADRVLAICAERSERLTLIRERELIGEAQLLRDIFG